MFYERDLDTFFKEMGETATVNGQTIKGILFDELKTEIVEGELAQYRELSLICKSSDVQNVKNGDLVNIRGTDYKVIERHEDTGTTTLFLGEL